MPCWTITFFSIDDNWTWHVIIAGSMSIGHWRLVQSRCVSSLPRRLTHISWHFSSLIHRNKLIYILADSAINDLLSMLSQLSEASFCDVDKVKPSELIKWIAYRIEFFFCYYYCDQREGSCSCQCYYEMILLACASFLKNLSLKLGGFPYYSGKWYFRVRFYSTILFTFESSRKKNVHSSL